MKKRKRGEERDGQTEREKETVGPVRLTSSSLDRLS